MTDDLDRLFGLPLHEFTSARDDLAAELRGRGDREAAAEVKGLRRPTVAAWTVNQLVREHPREIEDLLSVRADLRGAQEAALSGGGVEGLREIGERRRGVLDELLERAQAVLTRGGHAASRSTLDRVENTLTAATLDEEAAEGVASGRLARELTPPSGFESLTGVLPPPTKSAPDRKARERGRRAAEEAQAAEEEAERAEREARRLEEEAERMRKRAERARRKADQAAARAEELNQKARAT